MLPASAPLPPDVAAATAGALARSSRVRLDVRWYSSVASTMDLAAAAAQGGAPEGTVILADEQTAGRGRRGSLWTSPPGAGVYLSLLLRPPLDASSSPLLSLVTLATGVAVREAIAHATALVVDLKWPNDIVVQGRKLAGILAEGVGIGTRAQAIVLGIGVNVRPASYPPDVSARATSIETELGRAIDRMTLLEELLVATTERYEELRRGKAGGILRAWRKAAPLAEGTGVEWDVPDGVRRGITAGIDDAGALLVKTAAGIERIIAGELRWL